MLRIEKIFDVETGEESLVEYQESESDKKIREEFETLLLKQQREIQEKAEAKAELLAKLGITEDEAKLLSL